MSVNNGTSNSADLSVVAVDFSHPATEQLTLIGYQQGDPLFLRAINKTGFARKFATNFPQLPSDLQFFNQDGCGIYFVVNGGGDTDHDVQAGKAIFYEHDDLPQEDQLFLWQSLNLPEPTFQVDSGGKSIHSYWVLDKPINTADWKHLQRDLLDYAQADKSIKNPSRVMRLAGFAHQTTGRLATIVTRCGTTYTYEDLRAAIPVPPVVELKIPQPAPPRQPQPVPNFGSSDIPPIPLENCLAKSNRALLAGVGAGSRNDAGAKLARDLIGTANHLLGEGITCDGEPRVMFEEFRCGCIPALTEHESEQIWRSAEQDRPTPSCTAEGIQKIVQAWNKKHTPKQTRLHEHQVLVNSQAAVNPGDAPIEFWSNWDEGLMWNKIVRGAGGMSYVVPTRIGNHIEAVAYVKNPEQGGTGILLEFRSQRSARMGVLVPRVALVGDGVEALRSIVDRGYYYNPTSKKQLLAYLFGLGGEVARVYTIADKTGWVNGSFLTPAKTYGDPDLRFNNPEPDLTLTEIKGTIDGWKSEVAAKCAGNSRLLFSLGAAFAAPLLSIAEIESGGFHLVGTTSIGKTTSLKVAASVAGLKTIPNWRATSNALEGKAAEFNHQLLPLDEILQADPQTVGASAYMLGNGQGKARMTKTLANTKPKTWELLFLSTGEVGMGEYLRQAKIALKGGMEARMPSIPADAGKGHGVFEDLHGYQISEEFVQALETAIRRQQGTALDAYLTKLVAARQVQGFDKQLRERVHFVARDLSKEINDTAISRVAVRFALVQVGLELAHSFGLLPFPIGHCSWAVRKMFADWLDIRGGEGSIEIKEACNKIEHLFTANQYNNDRIADIQTPQFVRNLLAYRSNDSVTDGVEFWVPVPIFTKELADGVDKTELIKELLKRGWLKPSPEKDRPTLKRTIAGERQRLFVFSQFWLDKTDLKSGKPEKPLGHLGHLGHEAETVTQSDTIVSQPCPNRKNGSGTPGTPSVNHELLPQEESCDESSKSRGSVPSVPRVSQAENTSLGHQESIADNGFELGVPDVPGVPSPKRVFPNQNEKTKFKKGVCCTYSGKNPHIAKQYDGVLIIHEVNSVNGITALKPDGTLTSWLDPDELKVA